MEFNYTLEEIETVANKIAQYLEHRIILFNGKMGAGKTTLIKEIAKAFDIKDITSSPTFSIVNEYQSNQAIVYHFDFYRIEHEEEAYDIGIEEYLYNDHWKFIEWSEKIINLIPENHHIIDISVNSDMSRTLKIR